jgi:rhodanese-related sulfurtransferase
MARSLSRKDLRSQPTPSSSGRSTIGSVLLGAVVIVVASALLGIVANRLSPRGIPLLPPSAEASGETPPLALPAGVLGIGLEDALAAFHARSALFIDARPENEYAEAHIPGAVNIPPYSFEDRYLELMEQVEEASTIVVYCSGVECSDSIEVAERLLEIGRADVRIFEQGWRAWVGAGGPALEGPQP